VESRLQGEEQMAAKIRVHYANLLKVGKHVVDFAQERLFRDLPQDLTGDKKFVVGACISLVPAGVKIARGIHCLAANALDELGVMSLRPLGEIFASLGWIMSSPSERVGRAKLYMWGEIVELYKWTLHSIEAGITQGIPADILKDPAALLRPVRENLLREEIDTRGSEGADERADRRLQKLCERSNWATATWEEMFRVTENLLGGPSDGLNFAINYKMPSGILHGRHPRMFVITSPDEETIAPNFAADDTHVGWALFMSSLLLVGILDITNKGLRLGLKTEVQEFYDEIRPMAKQGRQPLGSPFLAG
jgi:hypothetical protein